jgi:hypothetical protein
MGDRDCVFSTTSSNIDPEEELAPIFTASMRIILYTHVTIVDTECIFMHKTCFVCPHNSCKRNLSSAYLCHRFFAKLCPQKVMVWAVQVVLWMQLIVTKYCEYCLLEYSQLFCDITWHSPWCAFHGHYHGIFIGELDSSEDISTGMTLTRIT